MHEDEEGALWFATRQGLTRFQNGSFFTWRAGSGLFNHFVYSIVDDGAGNFWFSSADGIFRVSKEELRAFARGEIAARYVGGIRRARRHEDARRQSGQSTGGVEDCRADRCSSVRCAEW